MSVTAQWLADAYVSAQRGEGGVGILIYARDPYLAIRILFELCEAKLN